MLAIAMEPVVCHRWLKYLCLRWADVALVVSVRYADTRWATSRYASWRRWRAIIEYFASPALKPYSLGQHSAAEMVSFFNGRRKGCLLVVCASDRSGLLYGRGIADAYRAEISVVNQVWRWRICV